MSRKNKALCVAVCITSIILLLCSCSLGYNNIIQIVKNKAEEVGLKDVTVTMANSKNYKIDCSNMNEFNGEEILQIGKKLRDVYDSKKEKLFFLDTITSNGDVYKIYDSTNSVYKNGESVYDDYYNSESHNSVKDNSSGYSKVSSSDDRFGYAVTAAKKLVKDELKSPSTAEFPWSYSEYSVECTGSTYKVTGYVDAQNSYGAVQRVKWAAFFTLGDISEDNIKISDYTVVLDE